MMRLLLAISLLISWPLQGQVRFVPNAGQWPAHVQHRVDVRGGGVQVEGAGWTCWQWAPAAVCSEEQPAAGLSTASDEHHGGPKKGILWSARWIEAHTTGSAWERGEVQADKLNYYLSDDQTLWQEGLQAASVIMHENLWPGVDVRWRGTRSGNAKFAFDVQPGADPSQIAWQYDGVTPEHRADGSLQLVHPLHHEASGFHAQLGTPLVLQYGAEGSLEFVDAHYVLEENTVRIALGPYDTSRKLVIDPEIAFSTFAGSTGDNFGTTASNGPDGSLVGGTVAFAPGYPTTPDAVQTTMGVFDDGISHVALTVFSPDGTSLLYSTYIGGSNADIPHSLAYNENWGNIVLFGTTGSSDFPVTPGTYQTALAQGPSSEITIYGVDVQPNGVDCFLLTLSGTDFTLDASTYFGGSGIDGINSATGLRANFGDHYRGQVDIGPEGSIWIATTTTSTDLSMPGSPAHAGSFDALLAGFSADLTDLLCGRTLGGSGDDAAYSIEVAPDNTFGALGNLDIVVGGGTMSGNMPFPGGGIQPAPAGGTEGWVARMTAGSDNLTVQFGTYHGLAEYDQVYFVQRDATGRPYAFGQARTGMPILGDVYANPGSGQYITCFFEDLSDIAWQTTIGTESGTIDISPTAFLISDCDQVYISGWGGQTNATGGTSAVAGSTTSGLPTTDSPFQSSTDGSDFYLAVLAPNAADLVYATFFGGQFANEHVDGGSSRFDPNGTVYQAVCAGCGSMDDFPSTDNAWSPTNPSPNCNMGVFKFELGKLNADIDIDGPDQFCQGDEVQFENLTVGPAAFTWSFGDATFSNEIAPLHLYGLNGTFEVEVIAEDTTGCLAPDTAYVTVTVAPNADPQIEPIDPLCLGDDLQLQGSGNGALTWSPPNGLSATDTANPVANPTTTTTYTLTDETLCGTATTTTTIEVIDMATSTSGDTQICLGDVAPLSIESPLPGAPDWTYTWFPPTGLSDPFAPNPMASPAVSTTYEITVSTPEGCTREHEITVGVVPSAPGGNVYPAVNLCEGQSTPLNAADGSSWVWSPTTGLSNPASQNPWANPTESTTYTVSITNLCGTGTDEVAVNLIFPQANTSPGGWVCAGEPFAISASGGVAYQWVPGALVGQPNAAETTVITETSQTFTAYVTDPDGCVASAEVTVNVWPRPTVEAGPDQRNEWMEPTFLYGSVAGAPVDSLWWTPADPLSCADCLIPEVIFQEDGVFTLNVLDTNGCRSADMVEVAFLYPLYVPSGFSPDADGINDGWRPEGHWLNGAGTYIQGLPNNSILPGYKVEVWDRWGTVIWSSEDPRAYWTGGVGGPGTAAGTTSIGKGRHLAPPGVYTWRVRFPTSKGIEVRTGKVTLIR